MRRRGRLTAATTFNQAVGERVRLRREAVGLEQAELAARFPDTKKGVRTGQWVSNIERGAQAIPQDNLAQFADELETTIEWLLAGAGTAERRRDSEFVSSMRRAESNGLDMWGRGTVEAVAREQVRQSQLRAISQNLSTEQAEWVQVLAAIPEQERETLLATARRRAEQVAAEETPRPVPARRTRQARQSS